MKKIIVLICLFGLTGCGFVFQDLTPSRDQGLGDGISKEEVIAKIGEPQKISKMRIGNDEYELWEYPVDKPQIEKMNSLGITASKVFFLDGKLVQLDKDRVYGQPGYEYLESIDTADTPKTPGDQKITNAFGSSKKSR